MANISKIKLPDGVTYDISTDIKNVGYAFEVTKTAGHWSIDDFDAMHPGTTYYSFAYLSGKTVSLQLGLTGDGSTMSAGGTCFTGTLSKGYRPIVEQHALFIPTNTSGFIGSVTIGTDGAITIKVHAGSINLGSHIPCTMTYLASELTT